MKKVISILSVFLVVLMVSGCGEEQKEFTRTCTMTQNDVTQGYKLESIYTIYGKGDVVNKVTSVETVTSDSNDILNYFETNLKSTYDQYNQTYGGYTNNVVNKDGKVVSETTIDYTTMNLTKYVQDNSVMKNFVNDDNQLLVEGLITIYQQTGAICE